MISEPGQRKSLFTWALCFLAVAVGCCVADCWTINGQRICTADEFVPVSEVVSVPTELAKPIEGVKSKPPNQVAAPAGLPPVATYGSAGSVPAVVTYAPASVVSYGCTGSAVRFGPRRVFYRSTAVSYGSAGSVPVQALEGPAVMGYAVRRPVFLPRLGCWRCRWR